MERAVYTKLVRSRMVRRMRSSLLLAALLLPVAGCAAAWSVMTGTYLEPRVTVRGVAITAITADTVEALFALDVENPNDFALDLAHFTYQLTVDGHRLAGGRSDGAFAVPRHGRAPLSVPASIRLDELGPTA